MSTHHENQTLLAESEVELQGNETLLQLNTNKYMAVCCCNIQTG
jgi:hypothetical protein